MSMNEKGVIFSIDALLAVILLALFVSSLAFLSSRSAEESLGKLLLKKQASDLLLAMDKSGLFAQMDQQRLNQTLGAALLPDTGYALSVEYYNYSGYGGAFSLAQPAQNSSRGDEREASADVVISQRNFVVAKAGQQPLYGVARLELWAR